MKNGSILPNPTILHTSTILSTKKAGTRQSTIYQLPQGGFAVQTLNRLPRGGCVSHEAPIFFNTHSLAKQAQEWAIL